MARQLYELCGTDPARVFSPFCWRIRMALAHKGLAFDSIPWRFTERERLSFTGHDKVPVLVDGARVVTESWDIATYLDEAYPDAPSLMHGQPAPYRFVAAWSESVLHTGIVRLIVSDIPDMLDPQDRAYFIESRERRFGMPLAQVTAGREERLSAFRASLQPLRGTLAAQPFLGGEEPDFADYLIFGAMMWARVTSPLALVAPEDAVHGWLERMLDLHGGLARVTPARSA